jgi:hypothetical protein
MSKECRRSFFCYLQLIRVQSDHFGRCVFADEVGS